MTDPSTPADPGPILIDDLDPDIARWIAGQAAQHADKGWSVADAIKDILGREHSLSRKKAELRDNPERLAEEIRAYHDHPESAAFDLWTGMAKISDGLDTATRLGLTVTWHVGDTEVPAPDPLPHPRIVVPDGYYDGP